MIISLPSLTVPVVASFLLPAIAFVGLWLLNNKDRTGWAVNGGAQILWLSFGLYTHQYGFAVSAPLFFFINLRGWIKWQATEPGCCHACKQPLPEMA